MSRLFSIANDPAQDPHAGTVDDISSWYHVQSVSKGGTFNDLIFPSTANFPDALAGTPARYFLYVPHRIDRSDLAGSRPFVLKDETTATTLTRVTGSPSNNEYRIPPENSIRRNAVEGHSGQAGHTISYDYYGEGSMFTAEEWNKKRWLNFYSVTASYTITDTDFYDEFHAAHSASTPLITFTLPTAADNTGRRILIRNTGVGLTKIDGEGAETLSIKGNSVAQWYLLMEDDWIECISNGTEWKCHGYISMKTNMISNSDFTFQDGFCSAFDYDTKSAAVDLTGQHFQIADGGSLQKAIIFYDSGGAAASGTMFVYSITDRTTSLGVWTNNQTCTCGSGGYTFDVNEGSGSNKNQINDDYHGLGIGLKYFKYRFFVNTTDTETGLYECAMGTQNCSDNYKIMPYQVDTNYNCIQSGASGVGGANIANGQYDPLTTDDIFYEYQWEINF